ncbi:lytic transglycosylase domain-containing protein [Ralstonia sp. ASV6]|uniref:lytic transglycosylase domain-containing protein n=1 Tax=Ralstonia sp. ASV6 TaxID=2795124 RepID=UPI0018EE2289|nr:lytic transglycosylase domain-containing protein [Ralstonia sp. ASV6]
MQAYTLRRAIALTASVFIPVFAGTVRAQSAEALLPVCAPLVHPLTMSKLVSVESGGKLYALADAGPKGLPWKGVREKMVRSYFPASIDEAEAIVKRLIAANHIVAIGLSQVSSQNLSRLGLSVRQVLDPCTNLNAGSKILTEFYLNARKREPNDQQAILAAISAYNTGNFINGFTNGYVSKVVHARGLSVPALSPSNAAMLSASPAYAQSYAPQPIEVDPSPPRLLSSKIHVLRVTREDD